MSGTAVAWSPASRREGSREAAAPETDGHRSARSGRAAGGRVTPQRTGGLSEDVVFKASQEGG